MGKVTTKIKIEEKEKKLVNGNEGKDKKKRLCYSRENVALALTEVNEGRSIAAVSRKYNIPESTIRAKKLGLYADKKPGPCTVLNSEEEKELANWVFHCCDKRFPVTRAQLLDSVKYICVNSNRKNPFINNTPGRSWYDGFIKRHPEVTKRISENVGSSKAKGPEKSLREWFNEVSHVLIAEDVWSIASNRIFSCNETEVSLNPVSSSVLAPRDYKNACIMVNNNENENITVLVTGNAAGETAPKHILFTGKTLPTNAAKMAPQEFSLGCTETGYMSSQNFYEYIANTFEPWLKKKGIELPVIFYVDRHASHMTLHLSKFCFEHGIILLTLHSNVQPLDAAFFQSFKDCWLKSYSEFRENSFCIRIEEYLFAPLVKRTFDSMDINRFLQNGFKKCGLYPFDFDAVDFTKVFNSIQATNNSTTTRIEPSSAEVKDEHSLKVLESLLSKDQLEAFKLNTDPVWSGILKDEGLFEIWYRLAHPYYKSPSMVVDNQEKNMALNGSGNFDAAMFTEVIFKESDMLIEE